MNEHTQSGIYDLAQTPSGEITRSIMCCIFAQALSHVCSRHSMQDVAESSLIPEFCSTRVTDLHGLGIMQT